jgi:archaellum component FlaC
MADSKVLQAILDGQVEIREDLKGFKDEVFKRFNGVEDRIDKLGLQIANLEDDAPTIEEFNGLEKRVKKLEVQFASA